AEQGRRGEVSAAEAVAGAIARAESVQPRLNAVAVPLYEEAAAAARRLDRDAAARRLPLAGVPVTVKESYEVSGTPACGGVEALADVRSRQDARVVAALRAAGAVIVAKGNLAQLLWFAETDNPVYGRTNNPRALDRSPGGPSGGDAAPVAAGLVPLAVDLAEAAAARAGAVVVPFVPPAADHALALFDAAFRADGGAALVRLLDGGPAHPHVAAAIADARADHSADPPGGEALEAAIAQ